MLEDARMPSLRDKQLEAAKAAPVELVETAGSKKVRKKKKAT